MKKHVTRIIGVLIVFGLVIAVLTIPKKSSKQNKQQRTTSSTNLPKAQNSSAPTHIPASKTQFNSEDVELPKFKITKTPVEYSRPPQLQMNDSDFMKLSQSLTQELQMAAKHFIQVGLQQNPENRTKIFQEFISRFAFRVETATPETKLAMKAFQKTWTDKSPDKLISLLNKFVMPSGWLIYYSNPGNYQVEVDIHQISKTFYVEVSDNQGTVKVPVIMIKPGIISGAKSSSAYGTMAQAFNNYEFALVYEGKISETIKSVKYSACSGLNSPLSDEEFEEKLFADLVRHETAHIFIAHRFKSAQILSDEYAFSTPIRFHYKKYPDSSVNENGFFHPALFQELCGVGIQIYTSELENPFSIMMYLTEMDAGYYLVYKALPLVMLTVGEDKPEVQELIDRLFASDSPDRGAIDFVALRQMLIEKQFTREELKLIGKKVYQLGYWLFQNADAGNLQLAKRKTE